MPTAVAEGGLSRWLTTMMQDKPDAPISKEKVKQLASSKFRFSKRGFERAWAKAVTESGAIRWSKAGRKSQRRIDTPI